MSKIESLNPKRVFYYFNEISKIPRESYHEKEISDYLISIGKKLNLETYQDENFNVILRRKAISGYENLPSIIIQGHMDMVCEKEENSDHDFRVDPIKLIVDGNCLRADKTTLGADNGIAIAMGMALLEEEEIKNPIELLITTREEVDLGGAMSLKPNLLTGKMLINLDSEDEGVVTVGSAGGEGVDIRIPIQKKMTTVGIIHTITLENLKGGHSGIEINQPRGNANKIMVEFLEELSKTANYLLIDVSGGSKDNAIPRVAKCRILSDENLEEVIESIFNRLEEKYISIEPEMKFNLFVKLEKEKINTISEEVCKKYIEIIKEIPTGVNTWLKEYPEIVESSDNLAIVKTEENDIHIVVSLRSAEPKILEELKIKIKNIVMKKDATCEFNGYYPEWRFKPISKLRDKALEVYKKMYNKDMKVEVIHAGLECGAISQNYPDIDFISIGPNLKDVHTPKEYLEIDSTKRVYEYLLELVKSL